MELSFTAKITILLGGLIFFWYAFGVQFFAATDTPPVFRRPVPAAPWTLSRVRAPPKSNETQKVVLFTTRFAGYTATFMEVKEANALCPRCIFTHDAVRYWNSSDAILFNGRFLEDPPPEKLPGQLWIYFQREAPDRMDQDVHDKLGKYKNLFNWTMTFRPDSDIFMPNAYLTKMPTRKLDADVVLSRFKSKTKMVAWIVSNCHPPSKREVVAKQLSQYVQVDIYGACGPNKCPTPRSKSIGTDCRNLLSETYKFYLSFENSLCQGYVTEKFFDILETDMIPIVYSGANYTQLGIPPDSYINVADFKTVQHLASFITWLNDNPKEYVKYLAARSGIAKIPTGYWATTWCRICDKLYQEEEEGWSKEHVYEDLRDWWTHSADGAPICIPPPKYTSQ